MPKRESILIFLIAVLLLVPIHACAQFLFMKNPLIGKEVPKFEAQMLNKGTFTLDEYKNKYNTIVFFWATWCPHCRDQIGEMSQVADQFKQKNIKVLLVDVGESKDVVQNYVKQSNIKFDVILDEEEAISEKFNIIGVPTYFFVNKKGIITSTEHSLPEDYLDYF